MKCSDCLDGNHSLICEACKRMQNEGRWQWEIDTGCRIIRCPDCGGGMRFGMYRYENPFRFCPYCGHQMIQGEQISMF